jgi:hypothetical protein
MKRFQQYTVKRDSTTIRGFFLLEVMVALLLLMLIQYYSTCWYRSLVDHMRRIQNRRSLLYATTAYLETGVQISDAYTYTEQQIDFDRSVIINGTVFTVPAWFLVKKVSTFSADGDGSIGTPVAVTLTGGQCSRMGGEDTR